MRPTARPILAVLVAGALAAAATLTLGSAASAQQPAPTVLTIAKVVDGTAAAGFTMELDCDGSTTELTFDASGAAELTDDLSNNGWAAVDGAFVLEYLDDGGLGPCSVTETDTAGADSVSWTCESTVTPFPGGGAPDLCDQPAGDGVGPATYEGAGALVQDQTIDIVFTNSFDPPPSTTTTTTSTTSTTAAPAPLPVQPVQATPRFTG